MYLEIYIYNVFWKNKKKNSWCAEKNRHALVSVHLSMECTSEGAPSNIKRPEDGAPEKKFSPPLTMYSVRSAGC